MSKLLTRLEALKDMVQDAIDKGATSVEQIHKSIIDLPLSVLEKQGVLDLGEDKRDELWNNSIGQIYEAIRRVNQEVGELASQAFEVIEDQMIIQGNIGAADADGDAAPPPAAQRIESAQAVEPGTRVAAVADDSAPTA